MGGKTLFAADARDYARERAASCRFLETKKVYWIVHAYVHPLNYESGLESWLSSDELKMRRDCRRPAML
jgi:hypothetical protein